MCANAHGRTELTLATSLYVALACGHERLAYNVAGTYALWRRGAGGRWAPAAAAERVPAGEWRPSLELGADGTTGPRRFNPYVLAGHVRGQYDVAPNAPSWCGWVALDIDAHIGHELTHDESGEIVPTAAIERAIADRDRRLGAVWRALGLGPDRVPVIVQTPGQGLHVWLPLTRGGAAIGEAGGAAGGELGGGVAAGGREHTWPAAQIVERTAAVLHRAGVRIAGGQVELYPAGRPLRAPCGRGTLLLDVTRPADPDALGLVVAPGTTTTRAQIAGGDRYERTVRRPWAMVAAMLARWEAARRPLDAWIGDGRPWCPIRGPFTGGAETGPEKNRGDAPSPENRSSQNVGEVQGGAGRAIGAGAGVRVGQGGRSDPDPIRSGTRSSNPSRTSVGASSRPAGGPGAAPLLLRGPAFRAHLGQLLRYGVIAAGSRHDAVLKLVFWWHVAGKTEAEIRAELEAWARGHAHASRLKGERLVRTCMREGMHYYRQIAALPQRARALAATVGRMRALAPADFLVLAKVREDVRDVAHAILEYLAGHADADGRVRVPVTLGRAQLDALAVRDVRIVEGGQRRRAEVIAVEELERLGVLTLFVDYSTGHHGRIFSCWYQFGSGVAAMAREPGSYERSRARAKAPADALVVGERRLRDGMVRVLSDGTRRAPVVELEPSAGLVVEDDRGGRWWRDLFERRRFTVGEFFEADEAVVIAGPWSRPPALARYREAVEDLPAYPARAVRGGSYDPPASAPVAAAAGEGGRPELELAAEVEPARAPEAAAEPVREDAAIAALAAALAVDVAAVADFDPELAALAAHALRTCR